MLGTYGLVISGAIIITFGVIFHLQGQGVVGPEQSFMYRSEDWRWYGLAIIISGIILACLAGIRILRRPDQ